MILFCAGRLALWTGGDCRFLCCLLGSSPKAGEMLSVCVCVTLGPRAEVVSSLLAVFPSKPTIGLCFVYLKEKIDMCFS